mmetsp:Transcript_8594/g.18531  ORF Transcript_8594/g.18531 Transcript_8594/m.18531 type:complete len:274 (+) Transcript_8594:3540-4361(+)
MAVADATSKVKDLGRFDVSISPDAVFPLFKILSLNPRITTFASSFRSFSLSCSCRFFCRKDSPNSKFLVLLREVFSNFSRTEFMSGSFLSSTLVAAIFALIARSLVGEVAEENERREWLLDFLMGTESPGKGSCVTFSWYLLIKPEALLFFDALKALCEELLGVNSGTESDDRFPERLPILLCGVRGGTMKGVAATLGVVLFFFSFLLKASANDIPLLRLRVDSGFSCRSSSKLEILSVVSSALAVVLSTLVSVPLTIGSISSVGASSKEDVP